MAKVYKDGVEINEVLSSVGNAFFSGISFAELWNCIEIASDREELDTAVSATIQLKELREKKNERSF